MPDNPNTDYENESASLDAEDWERLPDRFGFDPAQSTYNAACFLSRCAALAEKDTTLDEARRKELAQSYGDRALANTTTYPDLDIRAARDRITDLFEQICGASFIPRFARDVLDGSNDDTISLSNRRPTRIISARSPAPGAS